MIIVKLLTTYLVPLSIGAWFFWKLYKNWFIKVFPDIVDDVKDVDKASKKYDKKLDK